MEFRRRYDRARGGDRGWHAQGGLRPAAEAPGNRRGWCRARRRRQARRDPARRVRRPVPGRSRIRFVRGGRRRGQPDRADDEGRDRSPPACRADPRCPHERARLGERRPSRPGARPGRRRADQHRRARPEGRVGRRRLRLEGSARPEDRRGRSRSTTSTRPSSSSTPRASAWSAGSSPSATRSSRPRRGRRATGIR